MKLRQSKSKRGPGTPLARKADKYFLYQESVQVPEADVRFARRVFRNHFGRLPHLLREDFCGTAALSCAWVKADRRNRALGIDLDPEPLAWGLKHNIGPLRPAQRERVRLKRADVRSVGRDKADVICSLNFSFFVFKERKELLGYFRKARANLRPRALLILDVYGGPDAQTVEMDRRRYKGFVYVWDQNRFDPIHHGALNHIHFEFADGSRLSRAFTYDWRLWTVPELRELLKEAGFSSSEVYWEGTERRTGDGDGVFRPAERASDDPAWICYVVGVKGRE